MGLTPALLKCPDFLPTHIDLGQRLITFSRLSQESVRKAVFLNENTAMRCSTQRLTFRLDDVCFMLNATRPPKAPHYILHTAYCCSTLLTRYLELLPSAVVLREPQILSWLAVADVRGLHDWEWGLAAVTALLARTYDERGVSVIKTNVPCNHIADELLSANHESKIIFVLTELRRFLLSALKYSLRRRRIRYWNINAAKSAPHPILSDISPNELSDAENAAYFWLTNLNLCSRLAQGPERHRLLVIDGDDIAAHPDRVLPRVIAQCGYPLTERDLDLILHSPVSQRHSKNLSAQYNSSTRIREGERSYAELKSEVDAGESWLSTFISDMSLTSLLT
jgi:hypothetical protein